MFTSGFYPKSSYSSVSQHDKNISRINMSSTLFLVVKYCSRSVLADNKHDINVTKEGISHLPMLVFHSYGREGGIEFVPSTNSSTINIITPKENSARPSSSDLSGLQLRQLRETSILDIERGRTIWAESANGEFQSHGMKPEESWLLEWGLLGVSNWGVPKALPA
ncbi:hypothetical protein Tco_1083009 [Tanacetum coccineum]|uniref:Uncharacterized protein n=1 Tax=Tanacetum coccineum TaxID=301880 RepID=A0ABQ5I242_9ASTR